MKIVYFMMRMKKDKITLLFGSLFFDGFNNREFSYISTA